MTGAMLMAEAKMVRLLDLPVIIATGYADFPQGTSGLVKLDKSYFQSDLTRAIGKAMVGRDGILQ